MKTSIDFLPEVKQNELKEIVSFATEKLNIDMIILFGSYARNTWVEDKYKEDGITYEYKSDFDLLFVIEKETNTNHKFEKYTRRKIERNFDIETPVAIIYHGIDYLNSEIEDGNYFFLDILKEGVVLYDSGKFQLSTPKQLNPKQRINKIKLYFDKWFKSANSFFINFKHGVDREDYINAAFELHQSAERLYMTVYLILADYKPKLHDLEKLDRMISKLDARFKIVFPKQTEEEKRLFLLLKKAYIDSRYKLDYKIEKAELEYLADRVRLLQSLTEKVYKEKIEQLEKE